jgi:hypothetical protein
VTSSDVIERSLAVDEDAEGIRKALGHDADRTFIDVA